MVSQITPQKEVEKQRQKRLVSTKRTGTPGYNARVMDTHLVLACQRYWGFEGEERPSAYEDPLVVHSS